MSASSGLSRRSSRKPGTCASAGPLANVDAAGRGFVDPWQAVDRGLDLVGEAGPQDLPRLSEALRESDGGAEWPARYRLIFGRDQDGRAVIRGQVELTLRLVCQRCLCEVAIQASPSLALALVSDGLGGGAESDGLPDWLDPLSVGPEVNAEPIRPLDLIEDELLLAMPQVPTHGRGECEMPVGPPAAGEAPEPSPGAFPDAEPEHPFAALARLKRVKSPPGSGGD